VKPEPKLNHCHDQSPLSSTNKTFISMGDHVQEAETSRHSDDGDDDYDEDDDASGGGGSNDRRHHGDHGDDSQNDHDDDDDDGDDNDDGDDGEEDGNHDGDTVERSIRPRRKKKRLPGHPNVVQIVQRPRTHVNHTYRDFSSIPNGGSYSIPGDIDRMTFPEKLFHLLSSTSSYAQESISWRPHGRAFRIKSEDFLQKYGLLKLYFGYARVQRFFKQLLNHDFKQITQGPDKGCFYNEVCDASCCAVLRLLLLLTFYPFHPFIALAAAVTAC
jgi:hypothetical protein